MALIICTGWSLTREQIDVAVAKYKPEHIIAINGALDITADIATILYCCDGDYITGNIDRWIDWPGRKITISPDNLPAGWEIWRGEGIHGVSHEYGKLHYNSSSGAQAINLAYLLGSKRIYLLGADCCPNPNHDNQRFCAPYKGRAHNGDHPYELFIRGYQCVADTLPDDVKVYNLSPTSILTCYEHLN